MDLNEMRRRIYDSYSKNHFLANPKNRATPENYARKGKDFRVNYGPLLRHLPPGARALDMGCGCGHCVHFLREAGFEAEGVDTSPEQIEEASRMLPAEVLHVADAPAFLAEHEGQYNLIVSNEVIEHFTMPEVLELCDLVYAALKPGGMFIFRTINADSYLGLTARYIDLTHMTSFTEVSASHLLRVAGFENPRVLSCIRPACTLLGHVGLLVRRFARVMYGLNRAMHWLSYPRRVLTANLIAVGTKPAAAANED